VISKLRFTFSFTVNFMMSHERSFAIGSVICNRQQITWALWLSEQRSVAAYILIWPAWWWSITYISVVVFCAVDYFLKSCNKFWQHLRDLVHRLWEIHAFLLYFCVFYSCRSVATISICCAWASISVSGSVFNTVDEFLKCWNKF